MVVKREFEKARPILWVDDWRRIRTYFMWIDLAGVDEEGAFYDVNLRSILYTFTVRTDPGENPEELADLIAQAVAGTPVNREGETLEAAGIL